MQTFEGAETFEMRGTQNADKQISKKELKKKMFFILFALYYLTSNGSKFMFLE